MIFATPPVFQEEALAEEGIGLLPPSQIRGGDCFHERPEESLISHLVPSGPIHSAAVSEADRRFVERTPFPGSSSACRGVAQTQLPCYASAAKATSSVPVCLEMA